MLTLVRRYIPFFVLPLFLACAVLVSVAVTVAQQGSSNSEETLSDDERFQLHAELRATSVAQKAEIIRDFLASGASVSTLGRVNALVSVDAPSLSLDEASREATLVVRGTVQGQRIEIDPHAPGQGRVISTVIVTDALRGAGARSIEVTQPGSITLTPNGEYVLGVIEIDPVLELGREFLLFTGDEQGGRHSLLPGTTIEITTDGRLKPNEYNHKMEPHRDAPVAVALSILREQ